MKLKLSEPGVALSLLVHGSLLALLIVNIPWLADKPMDDQMPEAVPIETISQSDFNQIMKGEKSSKDVTKTPVTKADKVAAADEQHDEPPKPDVQKEVPLPPPPKPAAPTPPVPTPPVPTPPVPPPPPPPRPQRPDPTPPPLPPEPPTPPVPTPPEPPQKPAPAKAAPPAPVPPERDPEAEVIKPAPPPPPKPVPKPPEPPKRAEVKPPPKPVPTPPKVPEVKPPPKTRQVDKPDQLAKLLDQAAAEPQPDPKPAPQKPAHKAPAHAKAAPSPHETAADGTAEPSDQKAFDPTDISRILNAQPAGAPPSTGRQLSKAASRGATSGTAPKMSPTQSDALDGLLADQFKQCWSYLGLDHGRYIPEIKVSYAEDGSLQNEPTLLNRPSDPAARGLAESALRAVRQCNPLHIPSQFAPFYDQWRSRILRFDPAEMAG